MPSPFADVLSALSGAFGKARVRWYLFGAQAAILYGAARLTADVDVTVALGVTSPQRLVRGLVDAGFTERVPDEEFVARTRVLPVVHGASGIPVDIVLAGPGLEELFLDRARPIDVDGVSIPVARAEDIVVMKLIAGRPKDLDDIAAVLAAHPRDLDLTLVKDTVRMVEEALGQSDLSPLFDRALASARRASRGPRPVASKGKRKR